MIWSTCCNVDLRIDSHTILVRSIAFNENILYAPGKVIYDIFTCHGRSNHWWGFFAPILHRWSKYFIKSVSWFEAPAFCRPKKRPILYFDTSLPPTTWAWHMTPCVVSIPPISFPYGQLSVPLQFVPKLAPISSPIDAWSCRHSSQRTIQYMHTATHLWKYRS